MRVIGNNPDIQDSEVRFVASGALTDGSTVALNSDGTVSVVSETSVTQALGSPTVFETANSEFISISYDANAQKVIVFYADDANSGYGTAAVGTVSGTSISFGTPVVFSSNGTSREIASVYDPDTQNVVVAYKDDGNLERGTARVATISGTSASFDNAVVFSSTKAVDISATYDANAQKIVISYRDPGDFNYAKAVVGAVSGTSISFGSPVTFEAGKGYATAITYDSNAQKVAIAYMNEGNSFYGTVKIGTVSGTSISFGPGVVFNSAATVENNIGYDPVQQKVIVAYRNNGNSGYGTAIVGTVSGTSISFGSPVVFESGSTDYMSDVIYDSVAQRVVIAYRDIGNSFYGTFVVGTVSGTSISFDAPVVFESAEIRFTSATYDSSQQKVVIANNDQGNSAYGTAIVLQVGYTSTNLTADNFIGFSKGVFSDTEDATIFTGGAVSDRQTSLTPGQSYYVQTDGSLSETAGSPSVFAGTAISSTDIIVKG